MTRAPGRPNHTAGYTVLRCAAPECATSGSGIDAGPDLSADLVADLAAEVLAMARECVNSSRGGVLISTGCTFGRLACRLRPSGPVLLVQPCDAERQPTRPAVRVGPLRTADDLATVRDWLRAGWIDRTKLPAHLSVLDRDTRAAAELRRGLHGRAVHVASGW